MSKITYPSNVSSLLKGADALLILGTEKELTKKRLERDLPAQLAAQVLELLKDKQLGLQGWGGTTLTGCKPRKLLLGVLPAEVGRHNSPTRAEAFRALASGSGIAGSKKAAVLCLLEDKDHQLAAFNAVGRCLPLFSMKALGKTKPRQSLGMLALDTDGKPVTATKAVRETVFASREVARLVDAPPSDMNPEAISKEARKLLKGLPNVKFSEIAGDKLLANNLNGIHAVGRTAIKAPRLVVATYDPKKKGAKHIALVGKGISYDTGGLNIKISGSMSGMKADMGGAAAVLGAFRVLASSGVKHKVSLVLCLAENAIGPTAYKPDDILHMHSGKTVEINNTDAEGRIVLADGVSWAARKLKADVILDAATLTGAQLVATGVVHAAIFSDDDALEAKVVAAGRRTGDLTHPLPFAPELYKGEFRSAVADMRNSVKNRMNAQSSCAAQFIYWHIEDCKSKWCHVDMSGPAMPRDRASGYGVALLSEVVRSL